MKVELLYKDTGLQTIRLAGYNHGSEASKYDVIVKGGKHFVLLNDVKDGAVNTAICSGGIWQIEKDALNIDVGGLLYSTDADEWTGTEGSNTLAGIVVEANADVLYVYFL